MSAVDDPRYPIGSIDNVLRVIALLRTERSLRVASVARELGVANSTAHRLLVTLTHHGFMVQSQESKAYLPGPALLAVGLSAKAEFNLRDVARRRLGELRDRTGESCVFSVLDGTDSVTLEIVEGTRSLRVVESIGDRYPAHLTAGGKAALAELSTAKVRQLYPQAALPRATERSIGTRQELEAELGAIRHRRFATNFGESISGVVAVGAAVLNPEGTVVGSVSLGCPDTRMSEPKLLSLGADLVELAGQIGAAIP